MADETHLLVKVRGDGVSATASLQGLSGGAPVEPILEIPAEHAALGITTPQGSTWLRVPVPQSDNPWDQAHALLAHGQGFAASGQVEAIEPDLVQTWLVEHPAFQAAFALNEAEFCAFDDQKNAGDEAKGPGPAWNLSEEFSGLAAARKSVGDNASRITIAHLDTGYDPDHITRPVNLDKDRQRNFVDKDFLTDARDRVPPGESKFRNRGHGTGTLSLLAGNRLDGHTPGWGSFSDAIGGSPLAKVIPVRIADWVVRLSTGTMVQGLDHARRCGAHVVSMSMGGVSSSALVDAINLAYEAGIVMVTAAGNNFEGSPSPKSIVFPARYRRVLAACGVMADGRAYAGLRSGAMQGNYGPPSKMDTALGAYTPNVPWAQIACGNVVDMDGGGTSAATPQIAAAAALWLAQHWDTVKNYPEPWMRIEAVRHALFESALRQTAKMGAAETLQKIGRGVMRADRALAVQPAAAASLSRLDPARESWSWLNMIFNDGGVSLAEGYTPQQLRMFRLELTQMAQRYADVDGAIADPDQAAEASDRLRYLEAALDAGKPSEPLRAALEKMLGRRPAAVAPLPADVLPLLWRPTTPPPPQRRLRTFALDPSLGKRLDSMSVNETVLTVPWDDVLPWDRKADPARALKPGPVGEYLEVVDVDPASNRIYDPVDLNDRALLAQDGWPPSEGNPQFHQQMVYAVGMTTIGHFERALGRKALWAPHDTTDAQGNYHSQFVKRLRIYPHAFRGNNAYYSPAKKALLFGYFPSSSTDRDATAPGSMVFACLSSDIVAHEMTHALLDGLHRRFELASNPDVPAFHEGFADIVALFQHFTITELVRFEVSRSRADLSAAALLAGLAKQFGEGSSRGGPLRNYLDPAMQDLKYSDTAEPHARGSILVYAVYEAFLKIVARRIGDLLRIATGGTGVLPGGSLHPDLVNRVTQETCEAAADVLHMCIRALDYCPSVDITFGEYLRAIITADRDLVPDDPRGRRIAFMEAFSRRGILPRDVRTVSEETLSWSPLDLDSVSPGPSNETWSEWLAEVLRKRDIDFNWDLATDRETIFKLNDDNRLKLHTTLDRMFRREPRFCGQFGLVNALPKYNADGSIASQAPAGATTFEVASVRPARRVKPDGSFQTDIIAVINQRRPEPTDGKEMSNGWFWFRGGATLILDLREEKVRYIVVKNMASKARLERQRRMSAGLFASPLRALYFGETAQYEPFAMMHAEMSET